MPEWEFLTQVAKRSGCGILLDLNNVFVNAYNHRFESIDYLKGIPAEHIGQIHLAGYSDMGPFYFDTHGAPVVKRVWEMYEDAMSRYGQVSTLVEWDQDLPSFQRLSREAASARKIYDKAKSHSQPKRDSALV
jgi:uncharacterized protein (UPF0276 family)